MALGTVTHYFANKQELVLAIQKEFQAGQAQLITRDSRNDNGSNRKDRFRMRYRLRLGFGYQVTEFVTFGARLRTGAPKVLPWDPNRNSAA